MHTSNVREQATRERVRKERARESERERALSPGGTRSSHSSRRFGSATHRGEKRPRHDRRPGREKKEIPQPGRPNARDGRLLLLLLLPTAVVARRLGRLLREVFGANRRVFPGWMTTSWYRVYCQLGRAQSARCTSRDDGRRRDGETERRRDNARQGPILGHLCRGRVRPRFPHMVSRSLVWYVASPKRVKYPT